MGVYKRKLPSGNISWIADYVDPFSGDRKREAFAKKTLADAKIEEITYRKIRGKPDGNERALKATIAGLVKDYKTKCLRTEAESSFNRNRRFAIERFVKHFGRPTLVTAIRYEEIEDYRDMLIDLPTAKKTKRANASVNREMVQVRRMFRRSKKRGLVLHNPFADDDGDLRLEEAKRSRHLKKDEFEKLMVECAAHLKPIVFTAAATGMRRGNILGLTWDRVDLKERCIFVPGEMTKNGADLNVPITESLAAVLRQVRNDQLQAHLARGRKGKPPENVFTYDKNINGRMESKPIADPKRAFRAACRRAKIDDVRFHDLRHTFATHLRNAEVDMHLIGSILGHSWTNMTQRYAHENWQAKKDAISHIEQLIANTAAAYCRTPQNGANESTVKQVTNA
jgi:integrase